MILPWACPFKALERKCIINTIFVNIKKLPGKRFFLMVYIYTEKKYYNN